VAIELATAYVSLVPETSKLEKAVTDTFKGVGKQAEMAGREAGSRLAQTATKALKDGWRPDQDIMAGIPNTRLDRIGARMGQVIGKGVASGLKARQLGRDFTNSFSSGASSIGLGRIVSGWRSDLTGQSNKLGFLAGKALSAGLTAAVGVGVAGVTMALKTGFDRLVALDTAQYKLRQILKTSGRGEKDFERINKAVLSAVEGTPFSLDQAFGTAVQAIGAGVQDIEKFMTNVADAAGFAGTDLARMGLIFNQVVAKGKLTGEETMQLMEAGLPAMSWIQKSYDLTSEQFEDMQRDGKVTIDMLMKAIEDNAPGMAKALGNTLQGSIDNAKTALAKTGANFLAAIFGGETGDATEGLKSAVQRITDMLNNLNTWVVANKDEIRGFFLAAKDAAQSLFEVLGRIASALREHPALIKVAIAAFAGFATIKAVATVATSLSAINTALGLMPAKATAALGPIGALAAALTAVGAARSNLEWGNGDPVGFFPDARDFTPGLRSGAEIALGPIVGPWLDRTLGTGPGRGMLGGGGSFASDPNTTVGGIPIPGLGSGRMPGTAGRGYFNSRAASQYLDARTDQFLISQIPSGGRYVQTSSADLTQGLGDCTSAIEDLINIIDGRPTAGRSMATGNAAEWLTSRGFRPGTMPGAFNVGFNANHMQATLPGGTPFNWGSNASAARRGVGGTGAFDPAFTQHFYRFDKGGVLPPGTSVVQNDTGQPELVLNPQQQQNITDAGVDLGAVMHSGSGAPPGPQNPQQGEQAANLLRTMGFVPASAGNTGVAGTSSLAGFINMGNEIVGGVIDTGANLAQQAVSAGIMAGVAAGTFGAAAPAAPIADAAASYGIQLAASTAKRISAYGFQLAGIGADVLVEQLFPFGAPRWLGYDYTQFAPQLGIQQAALGSLEQMGSQAINQAMGPQQPPQQGQPDTAPSGPAQSSMMAEVQPPTVPAPDLLPNLMGFDQGGMLPPGGLGINMTSRPEPVLTPQQWDAIASNSAIPMQGAPLVGNLYAQDMQGAIRELEKVKRRDMMQYASRP